MCNKPRKNKPKTVCREYSDNHLSSSFSRVVMQHPKCLVYGENLSNNSKVPSKLKQYFRQQSTLLWLTRVQPYFYHLMQQNTEQPSLRLHQYKLLKKDYEACYKVAELIIKA
jgi:hypothetical protein